MKTKITIVLCTLMLFIPWTILPLRSFDWALKSPAAEIMICFYSVFMIFSGIFTILAYQKWHIRGIWMQLCIIINSIYAAGGLAILLMMLPGRI